MTEIRIRLDEPTLARLDERRGSTSRAACLRDLIDEPVAAGEVATVPPAIEGRLAAGIEKAGQAYRERRPGYGSYVLCRLAMDVQRMEVMSGRAS